ncbi:hypothetical protein D3C71_18540 [compost metagenome]
MRVFSVFQALGAVVVAALLSGCSPDPAAHLGAMLYQKPAVSSFFRQIECGAPSSSGLSACSVGFPEKLNLPPIHVEVKADFPYPFKFTHGLGLLAFNVTVETKLDAGDMDARKAESTLRLTLEKVVDQAKAQGGEPLAQAETRYRNINSYYAR